jgi:hypothetical protein
VPELALPDERVPAGVADESVGLAFAIFDLAADEHLAAVRCLEVAAEDEHDPVAQSLLIGKTLRLWQQATGTRRPALQRMGEAGDRLDHLLVYESVKEPFGRAAANSGGLESDYFWPDRYLQRLVGLAASSCATEYPGRTALPACRPAPDMLTMTSWISRLWSNSDARSTV